MKKILGEINKENLKINHCLKKTNKLFFSLIINLYLISNIIFFNNLIIFLLFFINYLIKLFFIIF